HGVGLSFEEKRHLQRLEQNHQEIDAALAACTRDLKAAFAGRRRTIRRLIVAGALSVGTIITLVHLLATLVSSLAGLLLLFVFLFVFHRLFLWGLPRLLGRFWRWVAPGDLAAWQREIEALEEEQVQRTVELSHTEREIAALEDSEDLEEDEWGDWEEEEDLEDAFALGEGEEKENDLEDAGSPGGKDSTGKKLLTQFKAVLAKGKRARIAPRFGKKANNIHPGKEDHTQELDEPPAQPGEEEGEDLLEFDWD
ncbi:MAG TPA: hypothetical protein VFV38_00630, partial [Ktedonobacteraceae bacterium]|nr:hypothetical protein [Ktedonobacteraceae bacterium]